VAPHSFEGFAASGPCRTIGSEGRLRNVGSLCGFKATTERDPTPFSKLLPVFAVACLIVGVHGTDRANATAYSFSPTADAYVNASHPRTNYGRGDVLRVGRRPIRRAYVRFRVDDVRASIESATLSLFVARGSVPALRISRVTNRWRESSITWRRQPRLASDTVVRTNPVRARAWVSVDVSSLVRRKGRYSFRITSRTATSVVLRSAGSRGPRIRVETTPPVNTTPPQVLGTAEDGSTLKADHGSWVGSTPMIFAYQWQRCAQVCEQVAGATGASYVLSSLDDGFTLRVSVSASNTVGSSTAVSSETAVVMPPSEPPTVAITSAPASSTTSASATFAWTSTGTVASTQCQLDGSPFADCASPASYSLLSAGAHSFTVQVANSAGSNTDSTSWVVTGGVVVWSADHERGDASQWPKITTAWDDAGCLEHAVVGDGHARSGSYAMKMTIDGLGLPKAGCRQTRTREAQTGNTYVYEASYFLPQPVYSTNDMWNVFQFKSKCDACTTSDPMWSIGFERNPIRVVLNWKGGSYGLAGPFAGSGVVPNQEWVSDSSVPIGRWTTITVLLDQSAGFDGHVTVWHDGVKLFDFANVRTQYPNLDARWSVNNYSNGLSVNPYTLYVDDASISLP
jgi:Polysaccharide lyase